MSEEPFEFPEMPVVLSDDAVAMFPRFKGKRGVVVGVDPDGDIRVRWEHLKTVSSWHPGYLRKVPPTPNMSETE